MFDVEPFTDIETVLLYLNQTEPVTELQRKQLEMLLDYGTRWIIEYCQQDIRVTEPDRDPYLLGAITAGMVLRAYREIENQTTGISEQSFDKHTVKFTNGGFNTADLIALNSFRTSSYYSVDCVTL